jgi:hypothetical protein
MIEKQAAPMSWATGSSGRSCLLTALSRVLRHIVLVRHAERFNGHTLFQSNIPVYGKADRPADGQAFVADASDGAVI